MSLMSASRGSRPCGSRAPPPTSGAAAPDAPQPGVCYRLWDEPQTASLEPANRPEILAADLSGFVLDLAHWGVADPSSLAFLDPPPAPALAKAKALLRELGAIDARGTHHRRGPQAARSCRCRRGLPAWWSMRRPGRRRLAAEIARRAHRARARRQRCRSRPSRSRRCAAIARAAREMRAQWRSDGLGLLRRASERRRSGAERSLSVGALLALAYPDRVAKNRGAVAPSCWRMAAAPRIDLSSPLAREPFLAVAEISGAPRKAASCWRRR